MRTLLIAAVLLTAAVARAEEIIEVRVEDNRKTTSDTVKLIAGIDDGDDWTPDMVDLVTQRLVTSGLFKDVKVFSEPSGEGGVIVHLIVEDKHSWVIAPAFYDQPTNKGGGIGFGENNLFGRNQKLLIYGQVATGDTFFVGAFVDPSLWGTRLRAQYDLYLASNRIIEYAPPSAYRDDPLPVRESRLHYLNNGLKVGARLWGKTTFDVRLRAAHVGYQDVKLADGATLDQTTTDPNATQPPPPGAGGWDVSGELFFGIDTRANWYGLSAGHKIVAMFEQALPSLGSDFRYWDASLYMERATRVFEEHNLVLKGQIAYGHDLPFQQEFTSGGTTMRGWKNMQLRGDFQLAGNAEYSVPMFTVHGLAVRGLAFWDTTYTTFVDKQTGDTFRNYLPGSEARGLAPFKNSVGVGTRLYLRQIVLPLLGLDFGYGVERGDYEIYLAIGLTD
ncbi:MAG TPA: BamA/TamA family outer membrane protein [Kofleriaceae bacterium]|nr:BamA/TamA family outer membrane protein [Kofleriaceae bacterium]